MIEHKWVISNPDFHKFDKNAKDSIIQVEGNNVLEKEFHNYAKNFKKAAYILTTDLLNSSDIRKLDTYFFSVAYLYRHSLELILKAIGFKYIQNSDDRKTFVKDTFHNLSSILLKIKPHINSFIKLDIEAFDWLESLFDDMSLIDKESDSFRYPFGISVFKQSANSPAKYSIKPLFQEQTHINLLTFATKLEVAFEILNSYYLELSTITNNHKKYNPTFLEEGGSYYGQSVLGYSYNRNRFYPYVQAYTESAEFLLTHLNTNVTEREDLFFPICYLYRNGVELALKEILFEESTFDFQTSLKEILRKKHSLLGIWNLIKNDMERHADAPDHDTTLKDAEKYIVQLHNFDGVADKFRYPTNKDLHLHFTKTKKFDLKNVSDFFSQLTAFLYAVCSMMSYQNEMQAEMEAEYSQNMDYNYDY